MRGPRNQISRWVVLTGAPRSGKTTVINELTTAGWNTSEEIARDYLERLVSGGAKSQAILSNPRQLQRSILALMARRERSLDRSALVFLDRALPDGLGFYRWAGLNEAEIQPLATWFRYSHVFVLDPVDGAFDPIALYTDAEAAAIGENLRRGYQELGYSPTAVPPLPPRERMRFILDHLAELGIVA